MFRIVRTKRLVALAALATSKELQLARSLEIEQRLRVELGLVRQARDHFETDAKEWKARASKFIDQVGIASGMISTPAMTEPERAPQDQNDVRRIFRVLNQPDRPPQPSTTSAASPPAVEHFLGVSDVAAAQAVAAITQP